MSNQILISSGAKLRDLDDVIIGTDGILSSVGFDVPYGVPRLDANGKILVSELPNSVMEFKGVWNAATNTPYLVDGVGNAGDVYLCNVAGTVNFGAGPITFAVGDYAVYTGSVWARSSGAVGTVTSVAVSRSGDALAITGSPITSSGTINIGFSGNSTQYINGAGNLVTFPSIISQASNLVTEVYNETGATLTKGTIVYINGGHGNLPTVTKAIATSDTTSAQTYGVINADLTNNNNGYVTVIGSLGDLDTQAYPAGTQLYLSGTTAGAWTSTKPSAPIHLVYVGIVVRSHPTQGVVEIKIQNGYELNELHDVQIIDVANNDGIFYDSATSLWKNKTIAEVLGYTPANAATTLTINGTTYDLSANRTWNVGTVTSVGLSAPTGFSVSGSPVTSSGTLALSFAAGYSLPTNIKQSNWDDAYTWVAAFPTQTGNAGKFLTTDGSTLSWAANPLGTVTSVAMTVPTGLSVSGSPITTSGTLAVTFASGYSIPTDASQTNWNTAYTNRITSLTTTGSSGAATLISNTLNIPNYTLAGLGGVPTSRTLTINGVTYDLSADRTWTITAGISSVSGTAPISVSTVSGAATVSISQATTSTNGYLSSTDWNTFNGKQAGSTNLTSLSALTYASTSFVKMTAAGTFALDTNTYATTTALGNYLPLTGGTLTGALIGTTASFSGPNAGITLTNAADIYLRIVRGSVFNNIGIDSVGAFYNTNSNHKFYVDNGNITALTLSSTGAASFGSNLSAGNITTTGAASGFTINRRDTSGYAGGWYSPSGSILLDMIGVGTAISFAGGTGAASFISNVGIGIAPNTSWGSIFASSVLQLGVYGSYIAGRSDSQEQIFIGTNAYYNGTDWIRVNGTFASRYYIAGGAHNFEVGASGAAGSIISFGRAMTIANSGNILMGTTTDGGYKLLVSGTAQFTGNSRTLNINTSTRVLDVIGTDNYYGVQITGGSTSTQSYGMLITAGTSTSDRSFLIQNRAGTVDYFLVRGDGQVVVGAGTQSSAKFAISAPNTHFSYGNGEGATFNIQPASTGQGGVNLNASYWTGTGYPYINFVAGGNDAFRITPTKEYWWYAEDNTTARANIYYNLSANQYRIYSTNGSGTTTGIKIAQYNGTSYENVVTEARTLTINSVTYDLSANRSWTVGGGGTAAWPSLTGGARYGYDLQIRPATNSTNYGGFQFQSYDGSNAGYLLIASPTASDVYTDNGITMVADLGWLTLAQRSTAGKGVRIMSGTTAPTTRFQITTAGSSSFNITAGGGSESDRVKIIDGSNSIDLVSYVAGGAAYSGSMGMFLSGGGGKDLLLMVNEANIRFVTGGYTERMRLFNNGNLVIGSTSDNGYKLQVNGSASFAYGFLSIYRGSTGANDIFVGNDGSRFYIGGNTYSAGTVTATGFYESSDSRLKKLLIDNYNALGIENVKAKLYIKDGKEELGYFAQDLENVLKSSLEVNLSGYYDLSYRQVHTAKIAYLENKIKELEEKLNSK